LEAKRVSITPRGTRVKGKNGKKQNERRGMVVTADSQGVKGKNYQEEKRHWGRGKKLGSERCDRLASCRATSKGKKHAGKKNVGKGRKLKGNPKKVAPPPLLNRLAGKEGPLLERSQEGRRKNLWEEVALKRVQASA